MRIVSGDWRGRKISAPRGITTRPTADRVREALFSILFEVRALKVLDLFAGTGSIGLEALSRGAAHATFVERDPHALVTLKGNVRALNVPNQQHEILPISVMQALKTLHKQGRVFDVIFADPPYQEASRVLPEVLRHAQPLLVRGGTIILEHKSTDAAPVPPLGLERCLQRRYGEAALAVYETSAGAQGACRK